MMHKTNCKWNKEYPNHERCCCTCVEKTNEIDIEGRVIHNGDIVEFNPIGSTGVYRGQVLKDSYGDFFIRTDIREKETRYYNFNEIFGRAKIIKNYGTE